MTLNPPRGECYPRAHGTAARVRAGVYSLQKSGASDIGDPPQQLHRCFHGASPSDPRAMSRRFQLLEVGTERCPARDSRWSGAAACLNRFRGFSESILNWEKYILQCTDESICLAKRCCLHLFLSPCLVC